MKKQTKIYIEAELRDYKQTLQELAGLRDDLLNTSSGALDGMPRGTETSDPTYQKVSRLIMDRRIKRLELVVNGIEKIISQLDAEKMWLVELKYWQKPRQLTNAGIARRMSIDKRTVIRWSSSICYAIALELGEVKQNMSLSCHF